MAREKSMVEKLKDDEDFNEYLTRMGFTFEELTPVQVMNLWALSQKERGVADETADPDAPPTAEARGRAGLRGARRRRA
jgi:hypothetical protein